MQVTRRQLPHYYKLIFLAVLLETSVHGVDKQSSFTKLPSGYSLSIKDNTQATFPVISADSLTYCTLQCLTQPVCKYFTYGNGLCHMYHVWMDVVIARNNSNENTYILVEDDRTWHSIYSINSGSNIPVLFDTYQQKRSSDQYSMKCSEGLCRDFYRSSLIDIWTTLPIREVKLVFHNGTYNLLTVVFNGTGSDMWNWFANDRLLSSPWTDIEKTIPDYFSISGEWKRRFYINAAQTGCDTVTGWMMALEGNNICQWEILNIVPMFIYSTKSGKTAWSKDGVGHAASMSIYIRLN